MKKDSEKRYKNLLIVQYILHNQERRTKMEEIKDLDTLKIGLSLNHIAMSVDDDTLARIKPHLNEIERVVLEYIEQFK